MRISLTVYLKFKYQRFQQCLFLKIGKYWLHVTAREQRRKEIKTQKVVAVVFVRIYVCICVYVCVCVCVCVCAR